MTKLLRALKAEQRKLWSKGSLLGCFAAVFILSFALAFMCSVVRSSGSSAGEVLGIEHAPAAFAQFDSQTSWREQAQLTVDQCDEKIADTAVLLTDATGSERVILERRMAQHAREREIARYRLDNDLALTDWSGCYALILCLWLMIPVTSVITAVYASDMFAGEFSRGTVRMIVSRPVTRIKIYAAKLISALLLGWMLLGIAYAAAGIGCGALMNPAEGVYVGYLDGSAYTVGWNRHIFSVFLCGCGMTAVTTAFCAAVGNVTRSRGVSAAAASVLAVAGMSIGRMSGLVNTRMLGVLLPFCYDLTVPLCGVAYNSECSFSACAVAMAIHFVTLTFIGYAGFRRDI